MARPKSKDAVYLKVRAAPAGRTRSGELTSGARLPSESAVAEEFGVARGTAREALKDLENQGLAESLPAIGRVVRDAASSADRRPLFQQIPAIPSRCRLTAKATPARSTAQLRLKLDYGHA